MGVRPLLIDLRGAGEISLNGEALPIVSKKTRAILSMLALAPEYRLSRSLLKARLWGDRSESQASASLRQALSALRKVLQNHPSILEITQEFVSLDNHQAQVISPHPGETLLAGLDIKDHGFDDWLRHERSNHEINPGGTHEGFYEPDALALSDSSVVGIGVLNCLVDGESHHGEVVGDIVTDLITREIRNFGIAETYDYRNKIVTTQSQGSQISRGVDFFVQVSVQLLENTYFINCRFFDSLDNRQLWNGYCKVTANSGYLESGEFRLFVNNVLDAALFVFSSPGFEEHSDKRQSSKLALAAINEILKGRNGDLEQADRYLDQAYETNKRSVYLGWKTHLVAYLIGERLIDNSAEHRKMLRETVAIAEEQGRFNPVTLALVAHTYSFIFHDYDKALQIFERMFQLNPMQAICFDLSAVTNVYVCNKEQAWEQSQLAFKLGRFSPYRYCIDTTCTMAAAINERYDEAIKYGDSATQQKPTFTAALRYLAAAKSLAGDTEGANDSYQKLIHIEPDFSVNSFEDEDYPVAGTGETVKFLQAGISRLQK